MIFPNAAQNKFSRLSFQPHLASVMNVEFRGRKFSWPCSGLRNFSTLKLLGYTVLVCSIGAG